jgi:hypothetical protein
MPPESTGAPFANHLLRVLSNRSDVISELLPARVGRDLVLLGRGNPVLLAPEICLELFRLRHAQSFRGLPIKNLYRGGE